MRKSGLILILLLLGGCMNAGKREATAEARGFERGYRQAVKEQYWQIQNAQRPAQLNQP